MAGQDEAIEAASLTFSYRDQEFHQSGIVVKNAILTTGGLPYSLVLSHDVENIQDFRITVRLEINNKVAVRNGFVRDVFHNKLLEDALVECDYRNLDECAYFLVIGIGNPIKKLSSEFQIKFKNERLFKGLDVLTVSTPFGDENFLNCFNKGIISKILNEKLFLVDAPLSQGCEGGLVYLSKESNILIGMILLVPVMENDKNSGFNLCSTLFSILKSYCKFEKLLTEPRTPLSENNELLKSACGTVLLLEASLMTGSCVVLNNKGLLITCSHNIDYDMNMTVHVKYKGKSYPAKVLCCSSASDILDLAFLQICPPDQLLACTWDDIPPVKGQTICVIGYTKINDGFLKVVSKGIVMKHEEHSPVYVSCTTRFGNSGGGIFDEYGRLLAIVCGIVQENHKKLYYCHAAGIPIKMMAEVLHKFDKTKDVGDLHHLCKTKDLSLSKWVLFTKRTFSKL